jgi:hypothetical protein
MVLVYLIFNFSYKLKGKLMNFDSLRLCVCNHETSCDLIC